MKPTAGFKVIKPGFLSLFQDQGRIGSQQYGLSPSGALDGHAYRWGNYLLGNHNAASLEILWGNCVLLATVQTQIVVTGAKIDFTINHQPAALWQTHAIKEGDLLHFGKTHSGIRAYLCVTGGFQSPLWFNSRSVTVRENIGTPLLANEVLFCAHSTNHTTKTIPSHFIPDHDAPLTLRLLPGFQHAHFSAEQHQLFYGQAYRIQAQADRVAYQLQGEAIPEVANTMISEPMTTGAVQITQAGQPIVMMKEHPTIGGYPKIGTVLSLDLHKLAQKSTHDTVWFSPCSQEDAQNELEVFERFFSNEDITS